MISAFLYVPGLFGKSNKTKDVEALRKLLSACKIHPFTQRTLLSLSDATGMEAGTWGAGTNGTWPLSFDFPDGLASFDKDTCRATGEVSFNLQGIVMNAAFRKVGLVASGCHMDVFRFPRRELKEAMPWGCRGKELGFGDKG